VRSKNTGRFRRRNTAGAMSANQGCDDESSDADSAAKGCGFNRWTQRIDEIVELVSRSLAFSLGVR